MSSFLVDGLLKSNAGYFSTVKSPFVYSSENNTTGIFASALKIKPTENSEATTASDANQSEINSKRNAVESKASTSLLNSSIEITNRSSITQNISSAVSNLSDINEEIHNEVDPTRKTELLTEASTIISDLNTYLTSAFSEDANLSSTITVSSLTPSPDGGTFTYTSVQGVSSLSDLGISSLDFNDYQATSDSLSAASSILAGKQSSYTSSTTSVSTAVSNEISKFNADVAVLAESDKEEALKDLSNAVAESIYNFTVENTTPADTILTLLTDDSTDNTDNQNTVQDSTLTSDETDVTSNLNLLKTYISSSTEDSALNLQV